MPSFVPYTGSEDARFVHNRDDRLGEIGQQRERVVGKDSQIPSGTDESACPGEHERRRRYIKIRNTFKILLNPTLIYIYMRSQKRHRSRGGHQPVRAHPAVVRQSAARRTDDHRQVRPRLLDRPEYGSGPDDGVAHQAVLQSEVGARHGAGVDGHVQRL